MITDFSGKTAVLTGAGSGFGLACARLGARLGMHLVLVDVQQDALQAANSATTGLAAAASVANTGNVAVAIGSLGVTVGAGATAVTGAGGIGRACSGW